MSSPFEVSSTVYPDSSDLVSSLSEDASPLLERSPSGAPENVSSCNGNDGAQIQPQLYQTQQRKASLTYLNGVALVVSLQIGSGIFFTPSEVASHVPTAAAGVLIWLFAGLMVWTGAASFIELGRAIPINGGVQEYLRYCYGDFYGFMFSWVWVSVYKPASIAVIATIFGKHLNTAVRGAADDSIWTDKLVAVIGLSLLTIMNCLGTKTGVLAANGFLILKLGSMFSIVVTGFWIGLQGRGEGVGQGTEPGWFGHSTKSSFSVVTSVPAGGVDTWETFGEFVTALFAALFCYAGWETIGFVAGDMQNPSRDLPRVINSSMGLVITCFCLMNVSLYLILPMGMIRDADTVAVTFGTHVFGSIGGTIYSLVVATSCLGALNSNVFALGKLSVVASKRGYFPKILGDPTNSSKAEERAHYKLALRQYHSYIASPLLWIGKLTERVRWEQHVPVYSMLLNNAVASLYILVGSFRSLLTFIGIAEYIFFFFAVLGIFVLRRRTVSEAATPRTWTFNPIVFCLFSATIVLRGVITDPFQSIVICAFILAGWLYRRCQGLAENSIHTDVLLRAQAE